MLAEASMLYEQAMQQTMLSKQLYNVYNLHFIY